MSITVVLAAAAPVREGEPLPPGAYVIRLSTGAGCRTRRLTVLGR